MIGIIMTIYLLIAGIIVNDLYLRAAFFGVAALFYLGFVQETRR